jgi:tripartite-type tricarboxylate transporter receptor subunit TctC
MKLFAALCLALSTLAGAQYPNHPVHLVSPFAPGGSNDSLTRIVGQRLSQRLGQPVIVENKPGAGGVLGAEAVARSRPDGYTLLMAPSLLVAKKVLAQSLPYDLDADFVRIARLARAPSVLVVTTSIPVKTVGELIAYGKSHPATLTYASTGIGSTPHINAEIFKGETGIDAVHVPYKGGAPALVDLLAGRVHFMMSTPGEVMPHVKSGKVRALAVSGRDRMPQLPELPTFVEAGLRNPGQTPWWGIIAPRGTPSTIVDKLSTEIVAIMAEPEVLKSIEALGLQASPLDAQKFDDFFHDEVKRFTEVVRRFNIPPE